MVYIMENNIKVSVIIPVYNAGKYLKQCIDSLVMQSLAEMEIIFVNDCSPCSDDEELIMQYMEKDSRIKYIKHEQNKGTAGAINTGLENCSGKYVTIVGNDDYLLDNKCYEYLFAEADKSNADVAGFGAYSFNDGNDRDRVQIYKNSYYKKARKVNPEHFPSEVTWNKLFKTDTIKKNDLQFNTNAKYEDIEFWYRYVITVNPVMVYIDKNYYMYRQRANSVMSTPANYIKRFDVYKMIYNFIKANNKEKEYRKNIIKWFNYPEQYEYFTDEIKDIYRQHSIEFMKEINVTADEIFNFLDMRVFKLFFSDKFITEKYSEVIENYKSVKYKYIKVNVLFYKLKREIKRLIGKF